MQPTFGELLVTLWQRMADDICAEIDRRTLEKLREQMIPGRILCRPSQASHINSLYATVQGRRSP